MQDQIIKGTGDSRYLRSSIAVGTTLEQIITLLRNGEFPIDFAGYNSEGIDTQGTDLNKANLLQDGTASLFGLGTDATPNDVLASIATSLATISSALSGYVPVTRTVNGKRLDSDITLSKSDVGLGKVTNQTITFSLDTSTNTLDITVG